MSSNRSSTKKGSGRSMTLALVLFILSWTIAPPTQRYFSQRAQINAIKAQVASNNQALADAAHQLQLWKDPEYIKTQARERLHFVLPGERQYIVTDGTDTPVVPTTAVASDLPSGIPWYNRLVASITQVGAK